jgi:glucokinase
MADAVLLIGDIGGTNARFALADPSKPGFSQVVKMACADFATAELAIEAYLSRESLGKPAAICLAAAGPIVNDSVRFTNNHWQINGAELQQRFGAKSLRLLNDFEAIAYSLPFLGPDHLDAIGLVDPEGRLGKNFNLGVLGPGTGLGVAGLIGRGKSIHPIVGEGGHRGFAAESHLQLEVLAQLRERFERVSDERLISGPGLENIYRALRRIQGKAGSRVGASEVFARAEAGDDAIAKEAVKLFFEVLGQIAGDLALAMGAFDGIFIAGGIVQRYPDLLKASAFRSTFEHKGRHRSLMERVPTWLITHTDPGLLGAAYCALQLHGRTGLRRLTS